MKIVKVSAAIITDAAGKIFAAQRGYGRFKDAWEFPGGKIEAGESPEAALEREIHEELAAEIEILRLFDTVEYDYADFHLSMSCFLCSLKSSHLSLLEHENSVWLTKDELDSVTWLPANAELIQKLKAKAVV